MRIIRVLIYEGEDEKVETELEHTFIRPRYKPQHGRPFGPGVEISEEFRGTQEEFDKWRKKT